MAVEKTLPGASAGRTVLVTGGAGYIGSAGRRVSRAGLGSAGRGLRRGWRAGLGAGHDGVRGRAGREAGAVYTPLLIVSRDLFLSPLFYLLVEYCLKSAICFCTISVVRCTPW